MKQVYKQLLLKLQEYLPDFKVANAVVHFDEASPHMHVVGVPVGRGLSAACQQKCQSDLYSRPKSYQKFCRIKCGRMTTTT